MSHIGYDKYEEGNALLTKRPLESQVLPRLRISKRKKIIGRARSVDLVKTKIDYQDIFVSSSHFSWWTDKKAALF